MIAIFLLSLACLTVEESETRLEEFDVTLPESIGELEFEERKEFDSPGLGYAVDYSGPKCLATIYVYDHELDDIPEGKDNDTVAEEVQKAADEIKGAEEMGYYAKVQEIRKNLGLSEPIAEAFAAKKYTYKVKGRAIRSWILLRGHKNNFLKIRLTQEVDAGKPNDKMVQEFLEELIELLEFPAVEQAETPSGDR